MQSTRAVQPRTWGRPCGSSGNSRRYAERYHTALAAASGGLRLPSTRDRAGSLPAHRPPASRVFGVATFYSQFHLQPRARHIVRCCRGTACHVRAASASSSRSSVNSAWKKAARRRTCLQLRDRGLPGHLFPRPGGDGGRRLPRRHDGGAGQEDPGAVQVTTLLPRTRLATPSDLDAFPRRRVPRSDAGGHAS